jgi:hypothetical protein
LDPPILPSHQNATGASSTPLPVIVDKHSRMDKRSAKALKIAVWIPGTLALLQDDV